MRGAPHQIGESFDSNLQKSNKKKTNLKAEREALKAEIKRGLKPTKRYESSESDGGANDTTEPEISEEMGKFWFQHNFLFRREQNESAS
jgi:hypothetical protein